jgi:hypothetical protein
VTVAELLEAIAAHRASFRGVPVGGFREADRVLWALLDSRQTELTPPGQLVLGLHTNTQEQP